MSLPKICTQTWCQKEFQIEPDDAAFYAQMGVPSPTLCPDCREQRRMATQNLRSLYHRKCAATGKTVISNFAPELPHRIFEMGFWWSDNWDGRDSGRDFDFTRSFFEQFAELLASAPLPALHRGTPSLDENSDYTNYAGKNKDCYLIFDSDKNRDCLYSNSVNSCINVSDSFRLDACELCYECVDCSNCYGSSFLQNCQNCSDSQFLKNCIACDHCFGCVNLRNQKYHFFNEPLAPEEYAAKVAEFQINKASGAAHLRAHFQAYARQFPARFMEGVQNDNVTGDYLLGCKNAHFCFSSRKLWDCKYITNGFDDAQNSYDCTEIGDAARFLYECSSTGYNAENVLFTANTLGQLSELRYCFYCPQSSHLFGCAGLKKAKYCILNKQYSKAEYEELVPRIIAHMQTTGEWGEFFPIELSPFAYNETVAQDYFPLSKAEVEARGWKWREETAGSAYLGPKFEIPDDIAEVTDEITSKILTCEVTGKNYKIIPQELAFYKKMQLPLPLRCPDQRHRDRLALRNPRQLFSRACADCSVEIQTTFAPDRPERVLCETCYTKAVY